MRRGLLHIVSIIALAGALPAAGNAQDKSRPATAADFVGVFRLIDYPLEQQPKVLKQPIWTSRCQFFGHYPDGYWLHQETHAGTCTSGVPSKKPGLPQTVQWKFLSDGAVLIDRKDAKIRELWKVDRVTRPTHIDKINLIDGDIIMQLLDVERKHILWVRLLRRIGDASDD
ncbi:MAG: hypothetical protein ABWY07_06495 [Burkholderiales bacterium]